VHPVGPEVREREVLGQLVECEDDERNARDRADAPTP
jgi:hypothetical protein